MAITWLVIASYRNDAAVIEILRQLHSLDYLPFAHVLIIDSEGTDIVPTSIREHGWINVTYRSYPHNLGSGENLRERLRLAALGNADYAYALNHDAILCCDTFNALLAAALSIKSLGAAYPLSYLTSTGMYNVTGIRELPLPRKLIKSPINAELVEVYWSSSNGALYSLEPAKRGILPCSLMWMAWEDLEYGWRLHDHGYRQVIVSSAIFPDNNEYSKSTIGHVTDKPPWRTYYFVRNLILAIKQSRNRPIFYAVAAYRFLLEIILIVIARTDKWQRLNLLVRGAWHGLKGLGGRGPVP